MAERSIRAPVRRLDTPMGSRRLPMVPRWDADAFGKLAERTARFMGTARFLVYMTVFIAAWIGWNVFAPAGLRFDPYTFTFLTLMLSLQASYAAPLILLAQNRQADRDRISLEEDRHRAAEAKADTEFLAREIAALRIALGEVATRDFLRAELARLLDDVRDGDHRDGRRDGDHRDGRRDGDHRDGRRDGQRAKTPRTNRSS